MQVMKSIHDSFIKIHISKSVSQLILFFCIFFIRLIESLLIQTTYWPDEYWQCSEISHLSVFGYGFRTWEWEYPPIRSHISNIHVLIFMKILSFFNLDTSWLIAYLPRLLQCILVSISDYYVYQWCLCLFHKYEYGYYSLLITLFNPYGTLIMLRTLSNSTIYCLFIFFLYSLSFPIYITQKQVLDYIIPFFIISFSFHTRPDCVLLYLPICIYILYKQKTYRSIIQILLLAILIFSFSSFICLFFDSIINHYISFPLYSNFIFNIYSSNSNLYGISPIYTYIILLLPALLGGFNIYLIKGLRNFPIFLLPLLICFCISICLYSCISHKEDRFILPLLPLLYPFIAYGIYQSIHFYNNNNNNNNIKENNNIIKDIKDNNIKDNNNNIKNNNDNNKQYKQNIFTYSPSKHYSIIIYMILFIHILLFFFGALFFKRGTEEAFRTVSKDIDSHYKPHQYKDISFDVLLECHQYPGYSFLHKNITIHYLTCTPEERLSNKIPSESLYLNPSLFIQQRYLYTYAMPIYILTDSYVEQNITEFFSLNHYIKIQEWLYNPLELLTHSSRYIVLYKQIK
ncbi:hypothetical protein WA158_005584 [Blastocystis sp. Blastoise]